MRSFVIAAGVALLPALAWGDTINESEGAVQSNSTLATAQALSPTLFTPNANPNVFGTAPTATVLGHGGGNDVDFYSFTANGGTVTVDIDDDPYTFDVILSLFDSTGTLLAFDDDSFPEDAGTSFGFDSFLGVFTLPSAGTYYVAVSEFANFPNAALAAGGYGNLSRPDGAFGGNSVSGVTPGDSSFSGGVGGAGTSAYRLEISLSDPTHPATAVPLPGVVWGGMALFGGLGLHRRFRRGKGAATPA